MMFLDTPIPPQDYQENPYAHFARWRAAAPLHYVPARDLWLAMTYDMVTQLLRDERLTIGGGSSYAERSRPFRITVVRELRAFFATLDDIGIDAIIREIVDEAFRHIRDAEEADLVTEFAQKIPLAVMGRLLGVPDAEVRHLRPLGAILIDEYSLSPKRGSEARDKALLDAYFLRHLARARTAESTPLMRLIVGVQKEYGIADPVLADVCARTLNAGSHTTGGVISNILLRLLQSGGDVPREWASAGQSDALVDELLRLDSSVLAMRRRALCDFELPDAQVKEGQTVILLAAAANRDPAYFPNPDTVDLERSGKKHLSFSQGAFHCLGEPLARKEIAAAIEIVRPYLPSIEILAPPVRRAGWLVHEPATLRVKIDVSRHAH